MKKSGMMRNQFLNLIFCLCAGMAQAQDTLTLPIPEAQALATRALLAGETAVALEIAEKLLQANPDDRAALIIVAAAADPVTGREAGARAWALSETDAQRYEAARLTALAYAREERFTLATFWLRRALTVAPNDAETARTTQDAARLGQLNPWSNSLSFALVPSNNVNGGAADDSVPDLFGLPGTLSDAAIQQAGWRGSLGGSTSYRLRESEMSRTSIGAKFQLNRVWLTSSDTLPDDAFASDIAEVNLRHDQSLAIGSITGRLSYGRIIYRQLIENETATRKQSYDSLRLALDRRLPVGTDAELTLSLGRDENNYANSSIGEVQRNLFGMSFVRRLNSRDLVQLGASYVKSVSDNVSYLSDELTLRAGYRWSDQIGPVTVGVSGGVTWSDYPDFMFAGPNGRQDTTLFYSANIGFPDVSYAGFTPSLTISGSNTDSNIGRFTRNTFYVGLTLSSTF